jgi:hypothetical protein
MKKIFIISLLLILVFTYSNVNASLPEYIEVAGAIRNTGNGWQTISNSSHQPINISKIETGKDKIVIHHPVNAKKVVTFIATSDETMAKDGLIVGISGGLNYSYVYIFDRDGNSVSPKDYCESGSNIWIYGKLQ